ncbi:MAG TPA: hypothetical protein VMH86_01520 [Rhizomicrobium sp.]|nr:hypothetical protein [Rhizomicrobium sp.]
MSGDTLVELVYDADKRKTALAVSRFGGLWNIEQEVKIGTGEVLVPYAASNNLIANGCVLLPSGPVEYGTKEELLADIRAFLHRYVDLSPLFEEIAPYYVLLSWVHDAFNELPYLRLRGEYGTGKTRGLLAIGSICYRPFFASGASSTSAIFRTLDAFGGTLILDEADLPYSDAKADLVKIFNNGTVKGLPVLRTVQDRNKEFNPAAFKVFGPKIIAMRERFEDRALESRFLTEETGTRPLRADIPIQLPDALKSEALALRNRLLHFRFCEFFKITTNPSVIVEGIEPRLNQTALSLLSLVDDPVVRTRIKTWLLAEHDRIKGERRATPEAAVAEALVRAFRASHQRHVLLRAITDLFNEAHEAAFGHPMTPKWIGYMLRARLNVATHKSGGIYVVPASERPKVEALAYRYGIS